MWSRIANTTTSNSSSSMYRSLLQQPLNRSLLLRSFDGFQNASSHFNPSSMVRRQKHSQTQIKRLFKEHPARLRVEKRMWNIDRAQPRVIFPDDTSATVMDTSLTNASTAEQQSRDTKVAISPIDESLIEPTPQLTYPPIYTIPITLPNGWFAPMDPKLRPKYPFSIRRTKNKPKDAIGFLPIYTKYRKDGTKVVTRIKNISGDIETFIRELRIVLSLPQPANQLQSYDAIRLRAGNMIEIQGHRAAEIRSWLGQLGF